MQDKRPGWRDVESDEAKRRRWKVAAGEGPPHQAWYYAPGFKAETFGTAFLAALRTVFWSPAKGRVTPGMDVKADPSNTLDGVPVLRVTMPDRLVEHFTYAEQTFVLCRAMRGDIEVDFIREWDGLSRRQMASSPTIMGDVSTLLGGADLPTPAALLRNDRGRVEGTAVPKAVPPASADAAVDEARRPPTVAPDEVPEAPRAKIFLLPDPPRAQESPKIVPRARPAPAVPPSAPPARLVSALPAPTIPVAARRTPPQRPAPPAPPDPPEAPEPSERDPFLWVFFALAGIAGIAFAVFRAFF